MTNEVITRGGATILSSIDWNKIIEQINWERIAKFIEKNPKEFAVISLGAMFGVSHVCETHIKQNASVSIQKEAISQGKSVSYHPDGTIYITP